MQNCTAARRTLADLERLEHIRSVVARKHPTADGARLLLFSASGFDAHLQRASAERGDLELIDLERLYRGN